MYKNKRSNRGKTSTAHKDGKDDRTDITKIIKDIQLLGSSHMTWKEKKEYENRKVVSLGGKPAKQQRLPLSVARSKMKKQKEREQKMHEERLILGRFGGTFGGNYGSGPTRSEVKRRPEDRVLKSSEGLFRNGVLDVKHLLKQTPSKESETATHVFNKGKKKGKGKNKGKKSGGKKLH